MKLEYTNGLAKLEHTYEGVTFTIIIEEEMDNYDTRKCYTIFPTPRGKYKKDSCLQKQIFDEWSVDQLKDFLCERAYWWYEVTHRWENKG